MKKYTILLVFCLVSLIAAATVPAQGFTGPGANPPPPPTGPGYNPPPPPPGGPGFGPPPPPPGGPGSYPPPPPPGPGANPPAQGQFGYGFTGPQGTSSQYGFTGPSKTVSVAQAQAYGHGSPVIIQGNIVQAIGGNLYTFRDSSGEIVLHIGPREWMYYGATISPSDTIEISGEVHRRNWQQPEVHARFMKKL